MKEQNIQKKLIDKCVLMGCMATKLESVESGWPDVLVVLPNGKTIFVEVKKKRKQTSLIQDYMMKELIKRKAQVLICDTEIFDSVIEIINQQTKI